MMIFILSLEGTKVKETYDLKPYVTIPFEETYINSISRMKDDYIGDNDGPLNDRISYIVFNFIIKFKQLSTYYAPHLYSEENYVPYLDNIIKEEYEKFNFILDKDLLLLIQEDDIKTIQDGLSATGEFERLYFYNTLLSIIDQKHQDDIDSKRIVLSLLKDIPIGKVVRICQNFSLVHVLDNLILVDKA